jgi:eukaryotic-like serine/threonine-protein kinase
MFCPHCGAQLADKSTKCNKCGGALVKPSSEMPTITHGATGESAFSAALTSIPDAEQGPSPEPVGSRSGRVLGGRYQLSDCIGSGGMGEIYRARRLHIGDTVAVKILRREVIDSAQTRQRFYREAKAAALLHHPNAVTIHDFGEDEDGTAYIVMELLEGRSLRQLLADEGPVSSPRAYAVMRQACAAVDAAHRGGIIHRDLKPDNLILLDSHDGMDHVKILDFGIAKLREQAIDTSGLEKNLSLTNVGTVIGTPHYMSPEQCQGEPADARSDIYSLGVMLYEMLTGQVPFNAKTPTGVAIKHVTEKPQPPSELNKGIPPAVEAVVLRTLEKSPEARPQSALEFSRSFEAALKAGDPLASHLQSAAQPAAPAPPPPAPTGSSDALATSVMQTPSPTASARTSAIGPPSYETRISLPQPTGSHSVPAAPAAPVEVKPGKRAPVLVVGGALAAVVALTLAWWLMFGRHGRPAPKVVQPTPAPVVQPTAAPTAAPPESSAPEGMVFVPGGQFLVGREDGDEYERPAHLASISPFYIDRTEVTNGEYKKFVDATSHGAPAGWQGSSFPAGTEQYPVTGVTWEDATAYAAWAHKRLPTEEEWEFAARGTDGRRYPWGFEWQAGLADVAVSKTDKRQLVAVGQYPKGASPFGALDMSGNAWEWTASEFGAYPGGAVPEMSDYSHLKVIRGGSYAGPPERASATARRGWPAGPNDWPASSRSDYSQTGFRCAQDIKAR